MDPEELERRLIDCTRCGTCLKDCPVYRETLDEQDTARARVNLVKAVYYHRRFELGEGLRDIAESCLLCRACLEACPNKVDGPVFARLLRERVVDRFGQAALRRAAFRGVLPEPGRVGLAAAAIQAGQRTGLGRVVGAIVTGSLAARALGALPRLPATPLTRVHRPGSVLPPTGHRPKGRLVYFHGCLTDRVFPQTGLAVIEVLRRNGYEVVIPPQNCCGLPASAAGDLDAAKRMAQANVEALGRAGSDWVITDCASCGSALREYDGLLGTEEAKAVSARVRDINEFLVAEGFDKEGLGEVALTVTYHDPCHLKRYQDVAAQPRALLAAIPGLVFKEMRDAAVCCGAAGSFVLTHPDLARRIGARKAANALATGADAVVTACPSCRMQLERVTARAGRGLPAPHPVELLARSYAAGDARRRQNIAGCQNIAG
ncbi:MAG: (Fe-S)-binding protein, partial [Bacillota bacterium]